MTAERPPEVWVPGGRGAARRLKQRAKLLIEPGKIGVEHHPAPAKWRLNWVATRDHQLTAPGRRFTDHLTTWASKITNDDYAGAYGFTGRPNDRTHWAAQN